MVILQHFLISKVFRMVTQPQVPLSRWIIIVHFFSSIYQLYSFLCYLVLSPLPYTIYMNYNQCKCYHDLLHWERSHTVGYMHFFPKTRGANLKNLLRWRSIYCLPVNCLDIGTAAMCLFPEKGIWSSGDLSRCTGTPGPDISEIPSSSSQNRKLHSSIFPSPFFVYCS